MAVIAKDKAIHAYTERRFPRALPIVDRALSNIFEDVINKNAFGVLLALIVGALAVTGLIDKTVAVSIIIAWAISVIWVARINSVKRLTIISRLVVIIAAGLLFGLLGRAFGNYILNEYHRQQEQQKITNTSPVYTLNPASQPQPSLTPQPTPIMTPTPAPSPSPTVQKTRGKGPKVSQPKKTPCTWEEILAGRC